MKFPVMERKYMGRILSIKVWYEQPSMKCRVEYGLSLIDLPRHLDELWGWLRGIADEDSTERLYEIIKKEVNDMLREYYLNYNCSGNLIGQDGIMAEHFTFPEIPTINTYNVQNGQVHIMSGATPTELTGAAPLRREFWVNRYEPQVKYLSDEEYEEKKRNGELRSGCVYCVLN